MADEVHFTNLINSLLDNAVKYSRDKPVVTVESSSNNKEIIIKIDDNGIGMNKETLSHIFENFTVHIPAMYTM